MLVDMSEEQLEVEHEHHPCRNLLKRFIEWKDLKLNVDSEHGFQATAWFSGSGGNLCFPKKTIFGGTSLEPFNFCFGAVDRANAKEELLSSEFLCAQLLCEMAGKHFFMYRNDHSSEFMHDFDFPSSWQQLEMQMTVSGF